MTDSTHPLNRYAFPYCFQEMGPDTWVILNRAYKPLGRTSNEDVDYRIHAIEIKGLTEEKIRTIATLQREHSFYLYGDETNPLTTSENMLAYLNRLAVVSKLEVRPVTPEERSSLPKYGLDAGDVVFELGV